MSESLTIKELRSKTPEQLQKILAQRREKLRHGRFQVAAREVKNLRELRYMRREIARILTVMNSHASVSATESAGDQQA